MTPNVWRFGLPVAIGVILLWLMKPGGNGFMPVPIQRNPAPEWTLKDLDGKEVRSSDFAGRVVVLNFWATWCPPCVREIPDLESFHQRQGDSGAVVIGLSVDAGDPETVRSFVKRNRITYPVVLADTAVQERFGGIASIPTTFIIDREGRFAARYLGALTAAELDRVTASLGKPTPSP